MAAQALSDTVYDLQASVSALGAFICLWGLVQFMPCLWRTIRYGVLPPKYAHCARHAAMAMICLAGLVLAFARMNTIGFLIFGDTAAGLAYIAGMIIMVVIVTLGIWASFRWHDAAQYQGWRTPVDNAPDLRRVFSMLLIVVVAFLVVGILRIGQ